MAALISVGLTCLVQIVHAVLTTSNFRNLPEGIFGEAIALGCTDTSITCSHLSDVFRDMRHAKVDCSGAECESERNESESPHVLLLSRAHGRLHRRAVGLSGREHIAVSARANRRPRAVVVSFGLPCRIKHAVVDRGRWGSGRIGPRRFGMIAADGDGYASPPDTSRRRGLFRAVCMREQRARIGAGLQRGASSRVGAGKRRVRLLRGCAEGRLGRTRCQLDLRSVAEREQGGRELCRGQATQQLQLALLKRVPVGRKEPRHALCRRIEAVVKGRKVPLRDIVNDALEPEFFKFRLIRTAELAHHDDAARDARDVTKVLVPQRGHVVGEAVGRAVGVGGRRGLGRAQRAHAVEAALVGRANRHLVQGSSTATETLYLLSSRQAASAAISVTDSVGYLMPEC
eukprot:1668621-Pleurochrysis_carterae.AAC.1